MWIDGCHLPQLRGRHLSSWSGHSPSSMFLSAILFAIGSRDRLSVGNLNTELTTIRESLVRLPDVDAIANAAVWAAN